KRTLYRFLLWVAISLGDRDGGMACDFCQRERIAPGFREASQSGVPHDVGRKWLHGILDLRFRCILFDRLKSPSVVILPGPTFDVAGRCIGRKHPTLFWFPCSLPSRGQTFVDPWN